MASVLLLLASLSFFYPEAGGVAGSIGWSTWAVPAALGALVCALGLGWALSRLSHGRTRAWLRLDWFFPMLRKLRGVQVPSPSLPGRALRRLVPRSWQSDWSKKRRGPLRKFLRRVGPTWVASPVRRVIQGICLSVFLVLFFYVCWPYTARPDASAPESTGWTVAKIRSGSGDVQLINENHLGWPAAAGDQVFLFDADRNLQLTAQDSAVRILSVAEGRLEIRPGEHLNSELWTQILTGFGPLTICQRGPETWPSHYADDLERKQWIPAELFLAIDPLVSLSTAIASRSWVWSLVSAAVILIVCLLIPRGFCGYLCPLGTTIDLFDWIVGKRLVRFRLAGDGWWVHIKYYLLLATLISALGGVLVSGYVAAIPVITRAALFIGEPIQTSAMRGVHLVPETNFGQWISIFLFLCVLGLGFFQPRFWCKYVCPSGAVFSLGNLFRIAERKVESSCIHCNKCVEICPFDAIKADFTTRTTDCTLCQTCGGVCPTHAIKFVERWNVVELKVENDPPTNETQLGRRGFLALAGGSTAAVAGGVGLAGATKLFGANLGDPNSFRPVRPPGSVPEQEFLELCIRCGECYKACPNNVLQPEGFQQGIEGLWTPMVNADWAGCESSCNACGQVCPTGAIRALPIEEKKVVRMGLAVVDQVTCLPMAGREDCDLCVQECDAAGYHAIEYRQVHVELDALGQPVEGSGFLAPEVMADRCVGCGLCQTRCFGINVKEKHLLGESAIVIRAGDGNEDRIMHGSYVELRAGRTTQEEAATGLTSDDNYFVPSLPGSVNANESSQLNESKPGSSPADESPF